MVFFLTLQDCYHTVQMTTQVILERIQKIIQFEVSIVYTCKVCCLNLNYFIQSGIDFVYVLKLLTRLGRNVVFDQSLRPVTLPVTIWTNVENELVWNNKPFVSSWCFDVWSLTKKRMTLYWLIDTSRKNIEINFTYTT